MLRPKYNRCDFCGRNPHKVAVRKDGYVFGYCPSCWSIDRFGPRQRGGTVLYDRRKRAAR